CASPPRYCSGGVCYAAEYFEFW
nr:immunoglobulin heavy chain junction region [Macaca mulatta]MOX62789.1 immunoglobulin heavy chain junction region [Macaca mulatta]MOX65783.1 immunoglobulin heavy chain junction region [Macaca mulatta]MOX67332.1 immunoglobulin heavy chain junction region [Macaca mulatta]MOX67445.1 immunoglobulin heavy chain junction region [Macaca mulatta]